MNHWALHDRILSAVSLCRFHRDKKAWIGQLMMFVDLGWGTPSGQPALLWSLSCAGWS